MQVHIIEVDEEWHNQGYDLAGNNRPYWGTVRNKWTQAAAAAAADADADAGADGVDGAVLQEELCDTPPLLPGTAAKTAATTVDKDTAGTTTDNDTVVIVPLHVPIPDDVVLKLKVNKLKHQLKNHLQLLSGVKTVL